MYQQSPNPPCATSAGRTPPLKSSWSTSDQCQVSMSSSFAALRCLSSGNSMSSKTGCNRDVYSESLSSVATEACAAMYCNTARCSPSVQFDYMGSIQSAISPSDKPAKYRSEEHTS